MSICQLLSGVKGPFFPGSSTELLSPLTPSIYLNVLKAMAVKTLWKLVDEIKMDLTGKGHPVKDNANQAIEPNQDSWLDSKSTSQSGIDCSNKLDPYEAARKNVVQVLYISAHEQIQTLLVPLYAHILTVYCYHKGSLFLWVSSIYFHALCKLHQIS